ncbi:MAG: LptE family protein [Candidatus Zixiibacteriota bacterium]
MRRSNILISIILLSIIFFNGCWYYSFTDKPYPDIETVEIVPFDNQTTEYDLGDRLTGDIIDQVDGSGLLKVRNQNADSRIEGEVTSLKRSVHSYTEDETPEEYKVTIRAKISFTDLNKDKALWSSTFEGFGTYDAAAEDDQAITEALDLLIQRIIQRLRDG